ncbi:MAG TPA: glycosyltransferase family 4 protein [Thermodesulfobacteriota bacterium]|nr:glycosyltransferase family 4 protein [Thermodesulfobacteriota bacterium]
MELVFTGEFPPMIGGIGTYVYSRCQSPPGDGIKILAPNKGYSLEWDSKSNLQIERFNYQHGESLMTRLKQIGIANSILSNELISHHYRLITSNHFFPFGFVAALNKKKYQYKMAIFCHGAEILRSQSAKLNQLLFRYSFKKADLIIANSKMTAGLLSSLKTEERKIIVINPPVDLKRFNVGPPEEKAESALKAKLDLNDSLTILTVSRLDDIGKGIDRVIKIMPRMLSRWKNLKYIIIGDGILKDYYRELIQANRLEDHVLLVGKVSEKELPIYYKICHVFILLSRRIKESGYYEGFGIACKEAMACGKPIIISDEAGIKDYISQGVNGILVNPHDDEQIIRNIDFLLKNPTISQSMGKSAHLFASMPTDWSLLNQFT